MQVLGGIQIFASLLTFLKFRLGPLILIANVLALNTFVHMPLQYNEKEEAGSHVLLFMKNVVILGALWFLVYIDCCNACCRKAKPTAPEPKPKTE
jgi:hypothetical protein